MCDYCYYCTIIQEIVKIYNRVMKEQYDNVEPGSKQESSKWKILENYDREMRKSIDMEKEIAKSKDTFDDSKSSYKRSAERIIQDRYDNAIGYLEDKDKLPPASTARKIARAAIKALGLPRTKKSVSRQKAEIYGQAYTELEEERQQALEEYETRKREEQEAKERQEQEAMKRAREHEKQKADKEFLDAVEKLRSSKIEREQSRRKQEYAERVLNQSLTNLEEMKSISDIPGSGVTRRQPPIEYEGSEIPVYDLDGFHFTGIVTAIGYQQKSGNGYELSREIIKDPSIWELSEQELKEKQKQGKYKEAGNANSRSFIDTNLKAAGTYVWINGDEGALVYGFSKIRPGSIVKLKNGDAQAASNYAPDTIDDIHSPFTLASDPKVSGYNEVTVRRYDEKGKQQRPDYILARDNRVTEDMKRHAHYWGVPIININSHSYESKYS